ncbi:MAG: RES family NAD+ phosphorylase [Luteolibacter sp.]
MAKFYRLVQEQWAAYAKNGEGARLYGGRWNPAGMPAVYLAGSRALAALEVVVHAPRQSLRIPWCLFEVEIPDEWIENSAKMKLPPDWQNRPDSPGAQAFGGKWLRGKAAVALQLPSVIIPEEPVMLVNPLHTDAGNLKWSAAQEFRFDERL